MPDYKVKALPEFFRYQLIQHREFPDKPMPTTEELRKKSFDMMMGPFRESILKAIREMSGRVDGGGDA